MKINLFLLEIAIGVLIALIVRLGYILWAALELHIKNTVAHETKKRIDAQNELIAQKANTIVKELYDLKSEIRIMEEAIEQLNHKIIDILDGNK